MANSVGTDLPSMVAVPCCWLASMAMAEYAAHVRIGGQQMTVLGNAVVQIIGVPDEDVPVPPLLPWAAHQVAEAGAESQSCSKDRDRERGREHGHNDRCRRPPATGLEARTMFRRPPTARAPFSMPDRARRSRAPVTRRQPGP